MSTVRRTNRAAHTLLEVLIALAILGTAGLASLRLASDVAASARGVQRSEAEVIRASRFLDIVALWSSLDLDRHLGWRAEGDWRMHISREPGNIYLVAITDSTKRRTLVETSFYRPSRQEAPGVSSK
jgi:hypothetical protein